MAASGEAEAICFKVWWHFQNVAFDDILKNALARGIASIVDRTLELFFFVHVSIEDRNLFEMTEKN